MKEAIKVQVISNKIPAWINQTPSKESRERPEMVNTRPRLILSLFVRSQIQDTKIKKIANSAPKCQLGILGEFSRSMDSAKAAWT